MLSSIHLVGPMLMPRPPLEIGSPAGYASRHGDRGPALAVRYSQSIFHHLDAPAGSLREKMDRQFTAQHEGEDRVPAASARAFVLFNPGLNQGDRYPYWRKTVESLLATGRPVLLTAYDEEDFDGDLDVMRAAGARRIPLDRLADGCTNPFRCLKHDVVPGTTLRPVQSNRFAHLYRGKQL